MNDDVVNQEQVHQFGGVVKLFRQLDVGAAGPHRAGRMVVAQDDLRGLIQNCLLHHDACVHTRGADASLADLTGM